MLGQDYQVPASTVVRTSAGSYPVRYQLTQAVTVPAFGQAYASVEALVEGPRGNIDAYQINLVEGVAGFAIRVTNPAPISGAQSTTVRTVTNEDRERAWDLAAQQVMAKAYNGLQEMASLEPGRFLPRQSLIVQAAPRAAYTHLVGEQTDVLGLSLRLLVTGQAVDARDAQAVAYHQLLMQLPENYTLTDARYSIGEAAEEDAGYGRLRSTSPRKVWLRPRSMPKLSGDRRRRADGGRRDSPCRCAASAAPPTIEVSPAWFPMYPDSLSKPKSRSAQPDSPSRATPAHLDRDEASRIRQDALSALDPGDRRMGVAVSDTTGILHALSRSSPDARASKTNSTSER